MEYIKSIMKIIIIVISGIILLGSLLGEVFIYEFSTTVLSKRYILEKFDENNYYDNLYSNIVNEMEGYIGPSGLDENIFDNIITKEKIEQDVNIVVSNIYESKNADIDTKIIRQKLDVNINNASDLCEREKIIKKYIWLWAYHNKVCELYGLPKYQVQIILGIDLRVMKSTISFDDSEG